jgi:hypothetical protein
MSRDLVERSALIAECVLAPETTPPVLFPRSLR